MFTGQGRLVIRSGWLVMFTLILNLSFALAENSYDKSGNLIMRNGGFESVSRPDQGIANSWAEADSENIGIPSIDTEEFYSGKNSQRYATGSGKGFVAGIRQYVNLTGGKWYALEFWYKTTGEGLRCSISEVNLNETTVPAADKWTKFRIIFSAWKDPAEAKRPAGSVNEGGNLYFRTGKSDFVFFIDNVSIMEIEKPEDTSQELKNQDTKSPSSSLKTRFYEEGGEKFIASNLYDSKAGGWIALGKPDKNTVEKINTPNSILIQKFSQNPFPENETIQVTHDREEDVGEMLLYGYDWMDDVCHIDIQERCIYIINAADSWVRFNDKSIKPVTGNSSIYIIPGQGGDKIKFRSKAWTPRAVKFYCQAETKKDDLFPLKGITATEHDYRGVWRVLSGETNLLTFNISRRTGEELNPSEYHLIIESPEEITITGIYGSANKMIPLREYACSREKIFRDSHCYIKHTISLESYLDQLQNFLKINRGYPQTNYIGWASVYAAFAVPQRAEGVKPIYWYMRKGDDASPQKELTVETCQLKKELSLPENFQVCLNVHRINAAGPENFGVSLGDLLRRCGISTVTTNDKQTAFRMKKAGLETIFMVGYNPGFGGIDINGNTGRICNQKRILDGGEYYKERFFEFGRDMTDAFDGYELDFEPRGTYPYMSCFCDDCLAAFKSWSGIDIRKIPPKDIWEKYQDKWIEFRQWQYKETMRIYHKAVKEIHPEYKVWLNAGDGVETTEKALETMARATGIKLQDYDMFLDMFSPYFYSNTEKFMESFKFYNQLFRHARFAPWTSTSFGVGGRGAHVLSSAHLRLQMFIWYSMGAPAFKMWNENETGFDALGKVTIQSTLGELSGCENYYSDGKIVDSMVKITGISFGEQPDSMIESGFRTWEEIIQHRAHRKDRNILVTVFNIDPDGEERTATVNLAIKGLPEEQYKIINFLTKKTFFDKAVSNRTLSEGIKVSISPKDVLLLELIPQ